MSVSPLALLHEWTSRTDGAPLREFLQVGTEIDLPALEEGVVPAAMELGAAVTVLGAASQGAAPAGVQRPGQVYALVERSSPDLLPELALLVGDEHVAAAFGGGAPGTRNRSWTVLHGGPEGVPWALAELGVWLRSCSTAVSLPTAMAERLSEVAERLEDLLLTTPVETESRVVHNLDTPLVSQLPEGPVDQLTLHAPLRGHHPEALRALVDRLSPARVVLGVPGSWPEEDGEDAVRSLAAAGIEARARPVAEGFPKHGGLVEWTVRDQHQALTCGANLNSLTRPATPQTSLELGLILPTTESPSPDSLSPSPGEDGYLSQVAEELEPSGWSLEYDSGLHRVHGNFTNPIPVAAQVAELLEKHVEHVYVHAEGPKGWALLVWNRPLMLLASAPRGSAWRLYRVDPPATPSSRLGGSEGVSRVGLLRTSAPLHRAPHRDVIAFLATLDTDYITLLEQVGFLNKPL
ncbi:phospholipase D-like domain-containing protein [Nocardiopsis nanhaiensis]